MSSAATPSSATTLSQKDIVDIALSLINFLGDPQLVVYLLKFYIPIEREYLLEVSRTFHNSMRLKPSDRWTRLNDLCKNKDFSKITPNSTVPITCSIPIDGDRWRAQKELMTTITYMRGNFIRCDSYACQLSTDDKTTPSEKVRLLNYLRHERVLVGNSTTREAYNDFLEWDEESDPYTFYMDSPYYRYESRAMCNYQLIN